MARNFVYNSDDGHQSTLRRIGSTLNKWAWGALCCGVPGVPCSFCCKSRDPTRVRWDRHCVNQSTATADRILIQHRPHAPGGRKSTPEMISAVKCALNEMALPAKPLEPGVLVTEPVSHKQEQPG